MVHNSTLITHATPYLQSLLSSTSSNNTPPKSLTNLLDNSRDVYTSHVAEGLLSSREQWWFLLFMLRNVHAIFSSSSASSTASSSSSTSTPSSPYLKILEIGSFTGCASLLMAREQFVQEILLVDLDERAISLAEGAFREEGIEEKFQYFVGPAKHLLDKLIKQQQDNRANADEIMTDHQGQHTTAPLFHFIFIDADKQQYNSYYEKALKLLHPNGMMIVDNVLWRGQVWDENVQDETTRKMRAFNEMVLNDERVDAMLMPIGDGMYCVRKLPPS